jgi:hypothetical protein
MRVNTDLMSLKISLQCRGKVTLVTPTKNEE